MYRVHPTIATVDARVNVAEIDFVENTQAGGEALGAALDRRVATVSPVLLGDLPVKVVTTPTVLLIGKPPFSQQTLFSQVKGAGRVDGEATGYDHRVHGGYSQ